MRSTVHVLGEHVGEGGIGVAETSANGLVDEQQVVLAGPREVVLHYLGIKVSDQQQRPYFLQVADLRGKSWPSVQPQDGGVVAEVGLSLYILLAVESVGEGGRAFSYCQVSTCHDSLIVVGFGEVQSIA